MTLFIKLFFLLLIPVLTIANPLVNNVKLQLGNNLDSKHIGFFMAQRYGFYKDLGINLEIQKKNRKKIVNEIELGNIDFAVSSNDSIKELMTGKKIILLGSIYQKNPLILIHKKENVFDINDFKEDELSIVKDLKTAHLEVIFKLNKKDLKSIKRKSNHNIVNDFESDKIKYMIVNSYDIPYILKARNIDYKIYQWEHLSSSFYDEIIYTSKELLDSNPKLIKDFYKASIKGFEYAFSNIDESVNELKRINPTASREHLYYQLMELKKLSYIKGIPFGSFNDSKLNSIHNYFKLFGINTKIKDVKDIYLSSKNFISIDFRSRPPHMDIKNGIPFGPLVDILNLAAKELNKEIKWKFNSFNESLENLKSGETDIVPRVFYSKEREQFLKYIGPLSYSEKKIQFIKRKDDPRELKTYEDLKKFKIAVINKGLYFKKFDNDKSLKKLPINTYYEMIPLLREKKVDLIAYYDEMIVNTALEKGNYIDYEISSYSKVINNPNYIAVSKNSDMNSLYFNLEKIISKMKKEGVVSKIYNNYEREDIGLSLKEKNWIKNNPIIYTGGDLEWTPYYSRDKNVKTISKEYMNLISEKTGLKILEKENLNWNELLSALKQKKIDFIPAAYYDESREEFALISSSYSKISDSIYIQNNDNRINSFEDLEYKKLGFVKSSVIQKQYKKYLNTYKAKEYNTTLEMVNALENREIDAFIDNKFSTDEILKDNLIFGIKSLSQNVIKFQTVHMLINKDKKILHSIIQKVLKSISISKSNEIHNKWFTFVNEEVYSSKFQSLQDIIPKKQLSYTLLIFILIVFILLFINKKTNNNKIIVRISFITLTIVFLTSISIITLISLNNLENREKEKSKQSLEFVLNGINNTLNLWIDSKFETLKYLSKNHEIRPRIEDLLINKNIQINKKFIGEKLQEFKYITQINDNNFSILSKDFETVFSLNNIAVKKELFSHIKNKIDNDTKEYYVVAPKRNSHYYIYLIKPIKNNHKVLGYSLLSINPFKEFMKIIEQGRFGNTGETYALNTDAQMLSSTRFSQDIKEKNILLNEQVIFLNLNIKKLYSDDLTLMAKNVLSKKNGSNISGYLDYRGQNVFGAWIWNEKLNMGIASEIDKKEAIGTFEDMRITIFVIVFSIILFTLLLIFLIIYLSEKSKKEINLKNIELEKLLESLEVKVSERTNEIQKQKKQIMDSIEYASLIQKALIPENKMINNYFTDSFVIWNPRDVVGGDIYLFEELSSEDECILMVIDCTGHGVPGAFVTMLVKAIERQIISNIINNQMSNSPAEILEYFNKTMKDLLKQEDVNSISNAGFDGGIIYFNKKEKFIKYAGAKTPLFLIQEDELTIIKSDRHSIGYQKSDINYKYTESTIFVEENDLIYISTDGFFDQNGGEEGFPYGKNKFKQLLKDNRNMDMNTQKEEFVNSLQEYMLFEDKNDDITLIGLKV